MNSILDELSSNLCERTTSDSGGSSSEWLPRLLGSVPGLPPEAVPHKRPNHADLQALIADAAFHPAIEACLHLINGDLYSAHFLVRKAQGGSRYLDWLHAVLHKLEGDFRNAKMWYTDMGNNNTGALDTSTGSPERQGGTPSKFTRFHQFWLVTSVNGGVGERAPAANVTLDGAIHSPREIGMTAHQHTDLVFLATLSPTSATRDQRDLQKHFTVTTRQEAKIKDSHAAFSLEELEQLHCRLGSGQSGAQLGWIGYLTKLELVWMLSRMVEDFGWRSYDMAKAVRALQMEATPAQPSTDNERNGKAKNMVLDPTTGQRRF